MTVVGLGGVEPMPPRILWLASYPKSGNTWLRALLYNIVHGRLTRSDELQKRIPDAHKLKSLPFAADSEQALPIKTHWLPSRIPFAHRTAGFIYVARNPWDVVASNFDYRLLCGMGALDLVHERARYVDEFIAHRGDPRWRRLGMGGWGEHVRAWRALAAKVPNLWFRYEDLLDDPERELARLCRFLGLTLDRDAIRAAVAGASFANMRSLEERELRAGRPGLFAQQGFRKGQQSGRRFVNRGRADWGRDRLSPDQIARLAETFAAELELLGYTRPPAPLRAVGT